MSNQSPTSHAAALEAIREAASSIVKWASGQENEISQQAEALQLVFDRIQLPGSRNSSIPPHYRPAVRLAVQGSEQTPRIPYAVSDRPTDFTHLRAEICKAAENLNRENLSQLMMFLEIYGSHLSWGGDNFDIAIVDQAKADAAIAAALAPNSSDQKLALVGGDLMGVQKFIYTISSEGALKSLRARSFYLELATEEVVQQILTALDLPRTNVIYSGASKFYLLVAATDQLKSTLERIQQEFNNWLLNTFQRKVFLAIAYEPFLENQLQVSSSSEQAGLAHVWQQVNNQLTNQGKRKFFQQINKILDLQQSYQPCKVCHRDDFPEDQLKPLKEEENPTLACPVCREMYQLGDRLPEVKALLRTPEKLAQDKLNNQEFQIQIQNHYYRSVHSKQQALKEGEIVLQINNWELTNYPSDQVIPLLLSNYFQRSPETGGFLAANEMADIAEGIKRVGYLRMDVDRLSQIFSTGLGASYTLPRLASLSRQMTYFFKVYLNSLAEARQPNFLDYCDRAPLNFKRLFRNPPHHPSTKLDKNLRQNLLFIYAGGDDLFVSGAWDEVVAFGFDVYQAFRAYTGWHPAITLSGGICISGAKFPLYQAAEEAGDAEDAAKENDRDSLSLFGETFKWQQWLGKRQGNQPIDRSSQDYLQTEVVPDLQGILPFVQDLLNPSLEFGYPQSFIRNLLITAQLREQKIKEAQESQPTQVQDITYYLHLPKLAYALSRLPKPIQEQESFRPIRQSLMSPRNSPYFRAIATWIELLTRTP